MNHYEAKFAREAKEHPTNWIIAPNGSNGVKLVRIGNDPAPRPNLTLVVNNAKDEALTALTNELGA